MTFYCENHRRQTNIPYGQNAGILKRKAAAAYSNHCDVKVT
jgi:hypothetical protein